MGMTSRLLEDVDRIICSRNTAPQFITDLRAALDSSSNRFSSATVAGTMGIHKTQPIAAGHVLSHGSAGLQGGTASAGEWKAPNSESQFFNIRGQIRKMKRKEIDFDFELSRGLPAYNEGLGRWWYSRANDPAHDYAYRNIARYLRASLFRSPRLIVDYACGAGNLLSRLVDSFPDSRMVGLDGSPFLLGLARRRLGRRERVTLVETALPNFDLPGIQADLVIFALPNMVPSPGSYDLQQAGRFLKKAGRAVARWLVYAGDQDDRDEDSETRFSTLLLGRLVSLNLRRLLKPGGLCVRIEYGKVRRHELSAMELMRVSFEEGSLDLPVSGKLPEQWFRVLASSYFRSRIIEDVHQQTGGRENRRGGYLITVLRAV
jgi:SAM-dependent methyltransferase